MTACKQIQSADRLHVVSEYYFSKKLKEIADMNRQGADVINLGIGSPVLPPSKESIDEFCDAVRSPGNHSYQSYTGIEELRKAFAGWYEKFFHVQLDPEKEIQPLIGSKEGILHISLAFLNPGDQVLIPNPGYPTYSSVTNLLGAETVYYDLKESNNWYPDFQQLEQRDLSRVKLMWVNYPHMPTGTKATRELFRQLVAFGKKYGILICNDNPYSFILNDNPISILEAPDAKSCCIELNSLSKSHNMAGWRIAMLASNPEFVQWILKVKSNIDSGQFKPMMLAASKALSADQEWYDNLNEIYRKQRIFAEEIMQTLDCRFDPKQSGMFLWGRIPDHYRKAEDLCDKILYDAKVFITPGIIFGSNGEKYIRISLCCSEEKLIIALNRIKTNIQ
jgi:Aspartate/tyrosine/aromatic aminotransferase